MTFEKISSEKFANKQISTSQMAQVKGGAIYDTRSKSDSSRLDKWDTATNSGWWVSSGVPFS